MGQQYFLARNVHACRVDDSYVLLDAVHDRYLFFKSHQADWLRELASPDPDSPRSDNAARFAHHLHQRGLLTTDTKSGMPIPEREMPPPELPGPVEAEEAPGQAGWRELGNMLRLYLRWAHLQTADRRNLSDIMETVRRARSATGNRQDTDRTAALQRAGQFRSMTPWFFSDHDACFFRSLLLVLFLARYGLSADWVFGVRLSPFGAHCWVTHDGKILNEDPYIAASYRPIMIV